MNEWTKLVVISMELMVSGIVIATIIFLNTIAQAAGDNEQSRIDSVVEMKEYRHYNKWDNNTIVFYQDIVELILLEQASKKFEIVRRNGSTYSLPVMLSNGEVDIDRYERNSLETNILTTPADESAQYRATLIRDAQDPGLILGYRFIAEPRP